MPRGKKDKVPSADGDVDQEHNGKPSKAPLTDEQLQSLTAHHTKAYVKALAEKKKTDAEFKNICKLAKAEGVSVADIKDTIALETEEGREELRAEIERKHRVARWAGLPVGAQPSFFEEDRTPSIDKARADGKRAGLKGESANPPRQMGHEQTEHWMVGWHEGQKVLAERIKQSGDAEAA